MSTPADIPFDQLLQALLDVDTPLAPRFLYRLSDLDEDELAQLRKTWPDVPAWRRQALMEDAAELGERDTLLSFEGLCRLAVCDPEAGVRLPAARALWEYEHPSLIDIFLDLMETDADPAVRAAAASGLGRFVYAGELEEIPDYTLHEIEDRLIRAHRNAESVNVRRRALESLGFSGRDEVSQLIEAAFNSGDKDWMAAALFAMGRSANERWQPQVFSMLGSQFPALRAEAARAAGELEIRSARTRLLEMLDDPDPGTRSAAIWSLSQIGGEGVRDTLERIYEESEDEEEVDLVEEALDNLAFTEDMQLMPLFDFPQGEGEEEEDFEDLEDLVDDLYEDEDGEDEADGEAYEE